MTKWDWNTGNVRTEQGFEIEENNWIGQIGAMNDICYYVSFSQNGNLNFHQTSFLLSMELCSVNVEVIAVGGCIFINYIQYVIFHSI